MEKDGPGRQRSMISPTAGSKRDLEPEQVLTTVSATTPVVFSVPGTLPASPSSLWTPGGIEDSPATPRAPAGLKPIAFIKLQDSDGEQQQTPSKATGLSSGVSSFFRNLLAGVNDNRGSPGGAAFHDGITESGWEPQDKPGINFSSSPWISTSAISGSAPITRTVSTIAARRMQNLPESIPDLVGSNKIHTKATPSTPTDKEGQGASARLSKFISAQAGSAISQSPSISSMSSSSLLTSSMSFLSNLASLDKLPSLLGLGDPSGEKDLFPRGQEGVTASAPDTKDLKLEDFEVGNTFIPDASSKTQSAGPDPQPRDFPRLHPGSSYSKLYSPALVTIPVPAPNPRIFAATSFSSPVQTRSPPSSDSMKPRSDVLDHSSNPDISPDGPEAYEVVPSHPPSETSLEASKGPLEHSDQENPVRAVSSTTHAKQFPKEEPKLQRSDTSYQSRAIFDPENLAPSAESNKGLPRPPSDQSASKTYNTNNARKHVSLGIGLPVSASKGSAPPEEKRP